MSGAVLGNILSLTTLKCVCDMHQSVPLASQWWAPLVPLWYPCDFDHVYKCPHLLCSLLHHVCNIYWYRWQRTWMPKWEFIGSTTAMW